MLVQSWAREREMSDPLPPELWERILALAGPLRLAPFVSADVRHVAAHRVQRVWRAYGARRCIMLPHHTSVVVRTSRRAPLRRGMVIRVGAHACIRLLDRQAAYLFLPHPTAVIRQI